MDNSLFVAAVLVVAGVLALEFGISGAIIEGIALSLAVSTPALGWLEFLAQFGPLGLMFMAGFEVDPLVLRRGRRASLAIGVASFAVPLAGVFAACRWIFALEPQIAGLLGIGLSTTSLALLLLVGADARLAAFTK